MATIQNKLHVSEHSADGKLFAFLNSDGKLKIWNTDTSNLVQEVVPNYHLNAPFTCFTWINVRCSIGTQRKVMSTRIISICPYFMYSHDSSNALFG